MDFIVELPEANGFNALFIIVEKLGKPSHLVLCRAGEGQLTVPQVAKLFFKNWVRFFGILKVVLHDHDAYSQLHSGKCCGVSWICKLCLVALTIPKPMVRQSARIVLSRK